MFYHAKTFIAELVPPTTVMDALLLQIARGKRTSDAQIIKSITGGQDSYNKLDALYTDVKELHKNHLKKLKVAVGASKVQLAIAKATGKK
jgi:hypothetical protein